MTITFESIGCVAITQADIGNKSVIGKQVDTIKEGIQPTYGMTADDMGFRYFFMTVKWANL